MATFMDFGYFTTVLSQVKIFGENWIVMVAFALLISLAITSKPKEISILFLPVFMSLRVIGFYITDAVYVGIVTLAGIAFMVNALSYSILSSTLRSAGTGIGRVFKGGTITGLDELRTERSFRKFGRSTKKDELESMKDKLAAETLIKGGIIPPKDYVRDSPLYISKKHPSKFESFMEREYPNYEEEEYLKH